MSNTPRIQKKSFFTLEQPAVTVVATPDLPEFKHFGCGCDFTLKALADDSGDPLKNDKAGFLWWFNDTVNEAQLTLQKWNGTAWIDLTTLIDNTYGTFYDYGFFVNDAGESFIGYQLEWSEVLDAHDTGSYRIICSTVDYLAAENTLYSYEYCLKTYRPDLANGTVRIEYYLSGVFGLSDNDKAVKDVGSLNWYNSFRLNGWFGFGEYEYSETKTEYNTGQSVTAISEQTPQYELLLKMQPFFVHEAMRIDVMMGSEVLITDYNSGSPFNYIRKAVKKNSAYKPEWNKLTNKLADVTTQWIQEYNNLKRQFV